MSKIDEARDILEQLGLPPAQRNDISCLTLLALTGLSEDDAWNQAAKPSRTIHEILVFMRDTYDRDYAENTREVVRRQVIHPVGAGARCGPQPRRTRPSHQQPQDALRPEPMTR